MTYREAGSLRTLLAEVNASAPKRSKRSDGWIGDAAHASRDSDHNPWVRDARGVGVVRARDFTHDPKGGLDAGALAEHLAGMLGKHPALGKGAYVIWSKRIISTSRLAEGWRAYTGSNPHTAHVHLSVGTTGYDVTEGYSWPPGKKRLDDALIDALTTARKAAGQAAVADRDARLAVQQAVVAARAAGRTALAEKLRLRRIRFERRRKTALGLRDWLQGRIEAVQRARR